MTRRGRAAVQRVRGDAGRSVVVSAVVSLTLTPMMCGRLLRPRAERPSLAGARVRRRVPAARRGLPAHAGMGAAAPGAGAADRGGDAGRHGAAVRGDPQGLPAGAGHRRDRGGDGGGAGHLHPRDAAAAGALRRERAGRPGGGQRRRPSWAPAASTPRRTRAADHRAEAAAAAGPGRPSVQRAAAEATGGVPGLSVFTQPVQDIQIGTRVSRTQFQYTLVDTDAAELAHLGAAPAGAAAGARPSCATSPPTSRTRGW